MDKLLAFLAQDVIESTVDRYEVDFEYLEEYTSNWWFFQMSYGGMRYRGLANPYRTEWTCECDGVVSLHKHVPFEKEKYIREIFSLITDKGT